MPASDKIALFMDGANFNATAKTLGFNVDFKCLLKEFQSRGTLLRAFYYTATTRTHDILPANSRLKAGSLTGSILATVRPWSSRDGLSAAASSSWLFDSRTVRLPVCPSG
jgi:uncharacterized LabA/DUF88 family protein